MSHEVRGSGQVMYAAVSAIVIRDIQKKFIKSVNTPRSIAFLWIVLEPMMHIGIWMVVLAMLKHNLNTHLPAPLFILLGAVPYLFFRNIIGSSKSSIKGNKNFLLFRQIKPIDPIIAMLLCELLISALVFMVVLLVFRWFSVEWHIYTQMFWLVNSMAFAIFLLGLSLIVAIACFFFTFFNIAISVLMRISYLLSGVFYSADMIPKSLRDIMLYNPIFQYIEISRESFMSANSFISLASSSYLIKSALVTLMFGVALYLAMRQKIMIEIEQR